jgi:RNA polymerase sigma-70 factor (ECF subfamily)
MTFAPPLNAINAVGTEDPDSRVDPDFIAVNEARTGNVDAFEALVLRYQGKIVNYASAMTRDASDAEDVAQETFVRAYRSLHQFRGDSSFKTWLYRIATNVARTHLRQRVKQLRLAGPSLDDDTQALRASDIPSSKTNIEGAVIARDAINNALAMLPDELRVAIILRDVEGLDYKEIARVTSSPIGTVESRIFRARRALRPLLRPLVSAEREREVNDDMRTN